MARPPTSSVGFIGLGTMGGPMATDLAKALVPLVVFDMNPAASVAVAQLPGVTLAGPPSEVANRLEGFTA